MACEHIKIEGFGDCAFALHNKSLIEKHMEQTCGTYSHHEHGGNCHVCGSVNMIYSILYYHKKSNSYIRVGEDCAAKLDMGGTQEISAFRAAVQDARKAHAGKAKAQAILTDHGLSQAYELYLATQGNPSLPWEEHTIRDIIGKLVQYGSLSDKQYSFIANLFDKINNRAAIAVKQAAEVTAAANCPTGRVIVTGKVLSTKGYDSPFGFVTKMLVQDDTGFKVWCTLPSSVEIGNAGGIQKGTRLTFTISVEPSQNDPKFGFGKRPTKTQILSQH